MQEKIRTIREEPEYLADLRAILTNPAPLPQLLDELLEGVLFTIARNPRKGRPIMATNFYVIAQPLAPLGKVIRIYYEFDEDRVLLRAATVQ